MPDVDEKWNKVLELMRHLPPIRNVTAIRAWLAVYKPELATVFDMLARDATTKNLPAPKRMILFMMMAFAAGRAYQAANPDAPRDPDGYGG
jgi:hypothetical protein